MPFYDSPAFGGTGSVDKVNGITIHRASSSPCPVCGHPTGDCKGDSESPSTIYAFASTTSHDEAGLFYVDEDYYGEQEIITGVNIKKLIHKKGSMISLKIAKELGLLK